MIKVFSRSYDNALLVLTFDKLTHSRELEHGAFFEHLEIISLAEVQSEFSFLNLNLKLL